MTAASAHLPGVLDPEDATVAEVHVPRRDDLASSLAARAAISAAAAAALAACGGGSDDPDAPISPEMLPADDAQAARFLQQAQFSSTPAEIKRVRDLGYGGWLDIEMSRPVSITGWDWLVSQGYNNSDKRYDSSLTDAMVWNQLMTAPDALRKRLALAWSEIMVVSANEVSTESPGFAMAAYWDVLNKHAFGNYRDLLRAITLNPAMGMYLNTKGNKGENPKTGSQPDENYAREVMQLFTIGLYLLNMDGTHMLGAGGQPVETYTTEDVSNLARVFTGYDLDTTGHVQDTNPVKLRNPMAFNSKNHSTVDATFLGTTISGSTPGPKALDTALDTLFNHPNTAPFIARQLIQRLVMSNPSPAYIGRVAATFANNGNGRRGDLAAVTRAVLLDPEARANPTPDTLGKLREPMLRWVQWARTFGATSTDGKWAVGNKSDASGALGQSPLRSPSVFNYFRPGYVPPNTQLATNNLVAPEFQVTNENSVAGYLNFMQTAVSTGVSKIAVADGYPTEIALADNPQALVNRLNLLLAAGQLSSTTMQVISDAIGSIKADDKGKKNRVYAAIFMTMCCPEYLVLK